jgi:hypothetical protein
MVENLAARIKAKIGRGDLPKDDCQRIEVVVRQGVPCEACDEPLDARDGGIECRAGGRSFLLHAQCYVAWRDQLSERRPMVPSPRRPECETPQPPLH